MNSMRFGQLTAGEGTVYQKLFLARKNSTTDHRFSHPPDSTAAAPAESQATPAQGSEGWRVGFVGVECTPTTKPVCLMCLPLQAIEN